MIKWLWIGLFELVFTFFLFRVGVTLMNIAHDLTFVLGMTIHLLNLTQIILFIRNISRINRLLTRNKKEEEPQENDDPQDHRFYTAILILFVALMTGCDRIDAGYVGIVVNMSGSNKGVEDLPAQTGWVFYNPFTTNVYTYPTFMQTAVWTREKEEASPANEEVTFNSKEGMTFTGDISLSYQLSSQKVPHFYVKFRNDDLRAFTHGFLRNVARDHFTEEASKYSVEELYGTKKEEFVQNVKKRINDAVEPIGVHLEQFGFIGAPRPPQNVVDALNAKVAATQTAMKAENELRTAEAEAKKAIAKAQGEANANRELAKSITPELIQWRLLEIKEREIAKWDGKKPQVEGNAGTLLNIPLK